MLKKETSLAVAQKQIAKGLTSIKHTRTEKGSGKEKYIDVIINGESILQFSIKNEEGNIITVKDGGVTIPEWKLTSVEKMEIARNGISKNKLEKLKQKANLDYDKLSKILSTTRATLINKKGTEHFSSTISERIVSIADLYSYGYEVFEDEEKFNAWILRPNRALGGQPPIDLLDNQFGREEVKNVIGRIDYGVYS